MKRCLHLLLQLAVISLLLYPEIVRAESPPIFPSSSVLISEVQTGGKVDGIENGQLEFIEIYNPGDEPVMLTGWRLEYLSASHNGGSTPTRLLATLSGQIVGKQFLVIASSASQVESGLQYQVGNTASGALAKSGGQLRLVKDNTSMDQVVWGTAPALAPWWKSVEIPANFSIQRILPGGDGFVNGFTFYEPTGSTTPGAGPTSDHSSPSPCVGVTLSEMLPNPEGADTGKEFIEIYNPTDTAISLKGCSLKLGEKGKAFSLPEELLDPHAYRAFYDSETKLVLSNATGEQVSLFTGDGRQDVVYADNLSDNESWIFLNAQWQGTFRITPDEANILALNPNADIEEGSQDAAVPTPCGPGKERNPETNRCRNTLVSDTPSSTSCKEGHIRNLETNRCRQITPPDSGPLPCKEHQERNPETGRCRSVLSASTEPKPCAPGQERSPTTNRCKKVLPAARTSVVTDIPAAAPKVVGGYWWVAAVLTICLGYAAYEWRHDLANALHRMKEKRSSQSGKL